MLHSLLLALAPALVSANGLAEWQQPLSRHPGGAKCGRGRKEAHYGSAFSFFLNGDWRYYFSDYFPEDWQCDRGELTLLSMESLDEMSGYIASPASASASKKPKNRPVSFMVTIPLGTEEEGPLVIEPEPDWKLFHEWDLSVKHLWAESKLPGRGLNITSISLQQGSISSSKTSNVPLNLGTPYTNLPDDIYDYLAALTKPQRTDMGRGMKPVETVDCNAMKHFPDITLDFADDGFELTVKPEQYILQVSDAMGGQFRGKCVLLASRGGEISIGWAALRGMSVWLDWANSRTGFGKPKR
ncbi:hypothetical protein P280DRAFT_464953 [Massarina eburnea CBS 473.64]|uniref:Peptidase A1 domain-containing protein n=1 Tax=Massarina eburnea CBS 473.64 TaxID=1395130 RepID=A0A6A6SKS0_9PLEO|nr:hypothetical protein P280DRAFT_464953 [Massarina eburnea CBS 473.64]